jgi:molybdate transport system substrate-binding protein
MGWTGIGTTAAAFVTIGSLISISAADEIRVISANGMREVIAETTAKFETASQHKLRVTVVETGEIRKRVLAGETYDVLMVPSDAADDFEKAGRIAPSSAVALIRVNFGLATSSEGPRRDTSTPEALKRTFLGARTVLITDPATGGISGVHLMEVLNKLGIADEMKSRLVPQRGAHSTPSASSRARPIWPCKPSTRSAASRARRSRPIPPLSAHHRFHGWNWRRVEECRCC